MNCVTYHTHLLAKALNEVLKAIKYFLHFCKIH
jgi:hypothetical protein